MKRRQILTMVSIAVIFFLIGTLFNMGLLVSAPKKEEGIPHSCAGVRGSQWYDRNPISKAAEYEDGDIAPHPATRRLTYTCPSDKIAVVEMLTLQAYRTDAAQILGTVSLWFNLTPRNGSAVGIFTAKNLHNNAVDSGTHGVSGQLLMMFADDKLEAYTSDDSTGGTVYYEVSYKITEFDACTRH